MTIHLINGYNYDSNIFVITGKIPTIIDTGTGLYHNQVARSIQAIIDPFEIQQIILTHEHFDHCGGVKKIADLSKNNPSIIAHKIASKKIEQGESSFAQLLGGIMPHMPVDIKVQGGEKIPIGNHQYTCYHTPGHTPGCICLYCAENKTLFSGDTVFANGSFGRTDFPGGNTNQLIESIAMIATLDVENLFPGHESIVQGNGNAHIASSYQNIRYLG
jgi:hydroxyacylglutathione hydrolase